MSCGDNDSGPAREMCKRLQKMRTAWHFEALCRHTPILRLALLLGLGATIGLQGCWRKQVGATPDGAALFAQKCASCHKANNDMRAPEPEALRQMSKATI